MTAFEVNIRYEMAQKLLGSPFNNLINLGLDKIIERCFGIMYRAGALDPAPPSILHAAQSNQNINIQYESPLARAQRLEQVEAMQKTFAFVGQIPPEAKIPELKGPPKITDAPRFSHSGKNDSQAPCSNKV